jgi:hypothetical protein
MAKCNFSVLGFLNVFSQNLILFILLHFNTFLINFGVAHFHMLSEPSLMLGNIHLSEDTNVTSHHFLLILCFNFGGGIHICDQG